MEELYYIISMVNKSLLVKSNTRVILGIGLSAGLFSCKKENINIPDATQSKTTNLENNRTYLTTTNSENAESGLCAALKDLELTTCRHQKFQHARMLARAVKIEN